MNIISRVERLARRYASSGRGAASAQSVYTDITGKTPYRVKVPFIAGDPRCWTKAFNSWYQENWVPFTKMYATRDDYYFVQSEAGPWTMFARNWSYPEQPPEAHKVIQRIKA